MKKKQQTLPSAVALGTNSTGGKPNLPSLPVIGAQIAAGVLSPNKPNPSMINLDGGATIPGTPTNPTKPTGGKPNLPPVTPTATPPVTPTVPTTPTNPTKPTAKPAPNPSKPTNTLVETVKAPKLGEFTYDDFSYDKQFEYDDFNYDKEFSYDDFNYDKQFEYGDFSYGDFNFDPYAESDAVRQAQALLQQQMAGKPGDYQSKWQDEIADYMSQIENRDPFSYDVNADALYQQYKDNYIQQGQMAMMDTMGQAAAMTGGFGNSYAQSVGQQAYNQQLSQLNNVVPELYQMAYNRYMDEGQRLKDNYSMYMDQENMDYGRHQDNLSNWHRDLDYLTGRYDTERNLDYGKWQDARDQAYNEYSADRSLAYDQYNTDKSYAYNEFTAGRDLAYDQYKANRDLAYNEFNADRDLAYDQYKANRDTAYNEFNTDRDLSYDQYKSDKGIAYDQYNTEQDRAWDQYLKDLDKQQSAAELMAGTGDYSRLAQILGLSDAELKKIKDANAPKPTGGGGGKQSDAIKYNNLSREDKNELIKIFSRAETSEDLATLAGIYGEGYDPAEIDMLLRYAGGDLYGNGGTGVDTTVDPTSRNGLPTVQDLKKQREQENRQKQYPYMTLY